MHDCLQRRSVWHLCSNPQAVQAASAPDLRSNRSVARHGSGLPVGLQRGHLRRVPAHHHAMQRPSTPDLQCERRLAEHGEPVFWVLHMFGGDRNLRRRDQRDGVQRRQRVHQR